jgi:hypothetical protein
MFRNDLRYVSTGAIRGTRAATFQTYLRVISSGVSKKFPFPCALLPPFIYLGHVGHVIPNFVVSAYVQKKSGSCCPICPEVQTLQNVKLFLQIFFKFFKVQGKKVFRIIPIFSSCRHRLQIGSQAGKTGRGEK